jgi:hypothetical protein
VILSSSSSSSAAAAVVSPLWAPDDNCGQELDMSMEFVLSIDWVEAKQNAELMRQAAFFSPFCQ